MGRRRVMGSDGESDGDRWGGGEMGRRRVMGSDGEKERWGRE